MRKFKTILEEKLNVKSSWPSRDNAKDETTVHGLEQKSIFVLHICGKSESVVTNDNACTDPIKECSINEDD